MATTGVYLPTHRTQREPSDPYRGHNCAAYALSMAIDRHTLGGLNVRGQIIRSLTDEPIPDPNSPGLNMIQILNVTARLRLGGFILRQNATRRMLLDDLNGRGVVLPGVYRRLGNLRCDDFERGHSMFANRAREDENRILIADPLCREWRWYPLDVIFRYWEAYGRTYLATRKTPRVQVD